MDGTVSSDDKPLPLSEEEEEILKKYKEKKENESMANEEDSFND